ncbi:MAG: hypothetical protein ACE5QW_08540 [Thermoplasmata archaeon]
MSRRRARLMSVSDNKNTTVKGFHQGRMEWHTLRPDVEGQVEILSALQSFESVLRHGKRKRNLYETLHHVIRKRETCDGGPA